MLILDFLYLYLVKCPQYNVNLLPKRPLFYINSIADFCITKGNIIQLKRSEDNGGTH